MGSTIVSVWFIVSVATNTVIPHMHADVQSCEHMRKILNYPHLYKCVNSRIVLSRINS